MFSYQPQSACASLNADRLALTLMCTSLYVCILAREQLHVKSPGQSSVTVIIVGLGALELAFKESQYNSP